MIYDLKNNKKRQNKDTSTSDQLHALVASSRKGSNAEQLKISLEKLREEGGKEPMGKWWIRGEALLNHDHSSSSSSSSDQPHSTSSALYKLAKKQGMNTDLRRSIFCTILSGEDYLDAFEKILKLNLKGSDEREIVYVLLHCCSFVRPFFIFLYFYVMIIIIIH